MIRSLTPPLALVAAMFVGCGPRTSSQLPAPDDPPPVGGQDQQVTVSQPPSVETGPSREPNQAAHRESTDRASSERDRGIADAERLVGQGKFDEAAHELKQLLVVDPADVEVLFMLANSTAASGDLAEAVSLLDGIDPDHPEAGIPALGKSAQWCMNLERYGEAERRYNEVLRRIPDAVPARRQLAYLLNCQGRRHEAAVHIRELCKLGNVRQDELHSLIVLSHAMYDDPDLPVERGEVVYRPLGAGGVARKLFTDGDFQAAADAIQSLVGDGKASPAITALFGRIVAEGQDDQRFRWWLAQTDERTREFSDYWAALGTFLISQRRFEEATRALLEAVDRDPTDLNSAGRLIQTFSTLGDEPASQRWVKRWAKLNDAVKANNQVSGTQTPDPDDVASLVVLLEELHRPLEALMWKSIEGHFRGAQRSEYEEWNRIRQRLVGDQRGFPNREERLCAVDLSSFALPEFEIDRSLRVPLRTRPDSSRPRIVPQFFDVAAMVGLDHAYQVARKPQAFGFAIYQTLGGAVVVFDYDQDGKSDLYFTQGGSDPPEFQGRETDQLYRQIDGLLRDVTAEATVIDRGYALGATAGDWNQDGFPDLVVSNLGGDRLLINNGDGTFTPHAINSTTNWNRVPSSLAMADLTRDGLPDVLAVAYIDDPKMIALPKKNDEGEVLGAMSPFQFTPGADRIFENDGSGGAKVQRFTTEPFDIRLGLGLIVTDFNDTPGNEIFVGNDVYPDHLWVRDPSTQTWADIAPAAGCAFGVRGSKTASMGIAAADLDHSGTLDLHITNFQDRNVSLFLNLGESFVERNVQYGLAKDSQAVLGWGTQAIDYENDGYRDLIVTNGHIEKSITIDAPFEQPTQLFRNLGGGFELAEVDDASGYWDAKHLGRGLARLDFDRDGRNDFVVTHLGERSALLMNQTETDNHWIQLRLVGVDSERDAIGAKVRIEYDGRDATDWVIAGDGYFSRNEATLSFGLGDATKVDRISITWPSGKEQRIEHVLADQRFLIVENQAEVFALD